MLPPQTKSTQPEATNKTRQATGSLTWQEARTAFSHPLLSIYGDTETEAMWWRWFEKRTNGTRLNWVNNRGQSMGVALGRQMQLDLAQLLALRPLAYVLDEAWFLQRKFVLRGAVLIPRPETEELVAWVLNREKQTDALRVLDLGCGSGAIACSLGLERPGWKVRGLDIDPKALRVARLNARLLQAPVRIQHLDMRAPRWPEWDLVVCNPPYIGQAMEHTLSPGVAQHEPHLALFAPERDPIYYYRILADQMRRALHEPNQARKQRENMHRQPNTRFVDPSSPRENHQPKTMYMEMPSGSAASIRELFAEWKIETRTDAQGIDRMLRVEGVR